MRISSGLQNLLEYGTSLKEAIISPMVSTLSLENMVAPSVEDRNRELRLQELLLKDQKS